MSIELKQAAQQALDALEARCGTNADERQPGGVIEALRTALQQTAQQAEVTDAEIDALCLSLTGSMTRKERDRAVARTILALRPTAVPMNQDEAIAAIKSANITSSTTFWSFFEAGIRAAEAHHGITAQDKKKEAP